MEENDIINKNYFKFNLINCANTNSKLTGGFAKGPCVLNEELKSSGSWRGLKICIWYSHK